MLGFFLSSAFFAWQALTDLKDHPPVPQNTRLYTVLRTCHSVLCMERDIIQSRGEWPQTKYNLTNVFGYLNPFYTFCGVQIIPDKNIQIVKFIFRFSFFLFQKFSKNSKIFRKNKKRESERKSFLIVYFGQMTKFKSEFEVSFSLTLYNTLLFHLAVKIYNVVNVF